MRTNNLNSAVDSKSTQDSVRGEIYDARNYWDGRLAQNWGLDGVGHISYGLAYNVWLYRIRKQIFLREVRMLSTCLTAAHVLDVGSGTGFWLDVWKSLDVRSLMGVDVAPIAVERLTKKYPDVRIAELDVSSPAPPDSMRGAFNVVSAIDVLFHITADEKFRVALANISSFLERDGYLIFSDNFVRHQGISFHQAQRTMSALTVELQRAGFRIVRKVPMFAIMNTPVNMPSFVRLAWRLFMYPVHLFPVLGHIYGALLFPLEFVLTRLLGVRTSTELAICQKIASGTE